MNGDTKALSVPSPHAPIAFIYIHTKQAYMCFTHTYTLVITHRNIRTLHRLILSSSAFLPITSPLIN